MIKRFFRYSEAGIQPPHYSRREGVTPIQAAKADRSRVSIALARSLESGRIPIAPTGFKWEPRLDGVHLV